VVGDDGDLHDDGGQQVWEQEALVLDDILELLGDDNVELLVDDMLEQEDDKLEWGDRLELGYDDNVGLLLDELKVEGDGALGDDILVLVYDAHVGDMRVLEDGIQAPGDDRLGLKDDMQVLEDGILVLKDGILVLEDDNLVLDVVSAADYILELV